MQGVRHHHKSVCKPALIGACLLGVVLSAQDGFSPASYRAGAVPVLPVMTPGGGQVFVELAVSREGRVTAVKPLRKTAPFTDIVVDVVSDWEFRPAEDAIPPPPGANGAPPARGPVASKVLFAAIFRPPALNGPTLGEAPKDVAPASDETAFPLTTVTPPFPPSALGGGVVLLEARVDSQGAVVEVAVIRSARPFDDAAMRAARQWRFRPARVRGTPVSTLVYLAFGFPAPISATSRVPAG